MITSDCTNFDTFAFSGRVDTEYNWNLYWLSWGHVTGMCNKLLNLKARACCRISHFGMKYEVETLPCLKINWWFFSAHSEKHYKNRLTFSTSGNGDRIGRENVIVNWKHTLKWDNWRWPSTRVHTGLWHLGKYAEHHHPLPKLENTCENVKIAWMHGNWWDKRR